MTSEDEGALCALYRGARNKLQQLKILPQLFGCSLEEVRAVLIKHGYKLGQSKQHGSTLSREECRRRYELYKQGLPFIEIARRLGLTESGISNWARKNGLSAMGRKMCDEKCLALYNKGLSDADIARAVDRVPQTVRKWRSRNNLPSNVPPGRRKKVKTA